MLKPEDRTKLDGIVQQMTVNGESPAYIQSVVDDFKMKYDSGKVAEISTPQAPIPKYFANLREASNKQGSKVLKVWQEMLGGKNINPLSFALRNVGPVAGLVGDVVGGAIGTAASIVTPNFIEEPIKKSFGNAIEHSRIPQMVASYESWAAKHPEASADLEGTVNIASLLPIDRLVTGGTKLAAGATKNAVKTAAKATTKAADLTGDVVRAGVNEATGFSSNTVKSIIEHPEAFTAAEMANLDRGAVTDQVAKILDDRISALSEVGKGYDAIRALPETIKMKWTNGYADIVHDVLHKYGIDLGKDGKLILGKSSKDLTGGDVSAIERFINQYATAGDLTADQFLNTRSGLSTLSKYDLANPKKWSADIARDLRGAYDKLGKKELPGLKELDAQYAPEVKELNKYRDEFFSKKTGEFDYDKAMRKISNATGKNKSEFLSSLEKLSPGITEQINIVKAIEDIQLVKSGQKVGTYFRSGIRAAAPGGVAAATLTGNLPVGVASLLSYIVTNPTVAVGLLRAYGTAKKLFKGTINTIIKKMKSGLRLSSAEGKIFSDAVEEFAPRAENTMKEMTSQIKPTIENPPAEVPGTITPPNQTSF